MALIGYARVSTGDQSLDLQLDALRQVGCLDIYQEEVSGARVQRPELAAALRACRAGDMLVIWKLDRLGRNTKHLIEIVEELEQRKIGLKTLTGFEIDTSTPHGKLALHMFAALAEYERALIQERIMAGIAAARARGRSRDGKGGHSHCEDSDDVGGARGTRCIRRWCRGVWWLRNLHRGWTMHPEFWRSCILAIGIALMAGALLNLFLAWLWGLL